MDTCGKIAITPVRRGARSGSRHCVRGEQPGAGPDGRACRAVRMVKRESASRPLGSETFVAELEQKLESETGCAAGRQTAEDCEYGRSIPVGTVECRLTWKRLVRPWFSIRVLYSNVFRFCLLFAACTYSWGANLTIITPSQLPTATAGRNYSQTLMATGGTLPYV